MVLSSIYDFPASFAMVLSSLCEFPASFVVLNNLWSQMLSWTGFITATLNLAKFGFHERC